MHLVHRPVAHPLGAEGTPIAGAAVEDPPRITKPVTVLPPRLPDLQVVVRPALPQAERLPTRPVLGVEPFFPPGHRGSSPPTASPRHHRLAIQTNIACANGQDQPAKHQLKVAGWVDWSMPG